MVSRITTTIAVEGSRVASEHERLFRQAKSISFRDVSFVYNSPNDYYNPTGGNPDVLGCNPTLASQIKIKPYSWPELVGMAIGHTITLEIDGAVDADVVAVGHTEHIESIDYSKLITDLHTRGLVEIRNSSSWIATDERDFSFGDGDWWAVDLLGTTLGHSITDRTMCLYTS